ncbi:ribosome-associated translation inhibitor RaiA [Limibaculum sp. M0105]|uniref:Ribosome hibernation promoting factor n=1 Tax=Thermohalobaculum xanthum TaxID=2753746 RepID=A0A8J7MAL9_9RHOB|nr:ribosome-associated translation inhibitor RaiA [Thermohalobaculum xanthum]MBK0400554.1 ribosome-associated translation inhibitor RaiA [Thermohalobaculum xanthum]
MHITVSGKHIDIGDALRSHVEDRLDSAVAKYFDRAVGAGVVFSKDARNFFKCDASVDLSTGLHAQAQAQADDIYAAFEQAVDRIEKQVRRYKRRLKNHHQNHREEGLIPAQAYVLAGAEDDDAGADDATDQPVIIAETRTEIGTHSVGDAVMRMELAHAPFLIFRNESNGRLNVVFRRDDGNIGWIDPEFAAERA